MENNARPDSATDGATVGRSALLDPPMGARAITNSAVARIGADRTRVQAEKRSQRRTLKPREAVALYMRCNGTCGICGDLVAPDAFEIDHVIPVNYGGDASLDNLQITHKDCNRSKGGRLPGETKNRIPESDGMNGAELQAWREARGLSRKQLAVDLGIHYQTIVKWENDDRRLSPLLWRALEHLDCTTRRPPASED